jgi:hypothetical protein
MDDEQVILREIGLPIMHQPGTVEVAFLEDMDTFNTAKGKDVFVATTSWQAKHSAKSSKEGLANHTVMRALFTTDFGDYRSSILNMCLHNLHINAVLASRAQQKVYGD